MCQDMVNDQSQYTQTQRQTIYTRLVHRQTYHYMSKYYDVTIKHKQKCDSHEHDENKVKLIYKRVNVI